MDLILASASGAEERSIDCEYDIEVGGINTFELTIPYDDWTGDLTFGKRVYIPGTEYGGIIKDIEGDSSKECVFVRGITWRGYLYKKVCNGIVGGELNALIKSLLGGYTGVFVASEGSTGVYASQAFDHVPVGTALDALCLSVGYKLKLTYKQTVSSGYVSVEAVPVSTLTDEVSQDSYLDFTTEDDRTGVNHLICDKSGALTHLYADGNGNISRTQTFFGIDEITEYFVSEQDNIIDEATKHFKDKLNKMKMTVGFTDAEGLDLSIGDLVTGRDFITGITVTKPITVKIVKYADGIETLEYHVEGE